MERCHPPRSGTRRHCGLLPRVRPGSQPRSARALRLRGAGGRVSCGPDRKGASRLPRWKRGASRDLPRCARAAFLRDHAGWWMPTFGRLLEKRAQQLAEQSPDEAAHLRLVAGVARVLCAWIALERSLAGVAPGRRIISPSIAPQETDDSCGTCGSCAEELIHPSPS